MSEPNNVFIRIQNWVNESPRHGFRIERHPICGSGLLDVFLTMQDPGNRRYAKNGTGATIQEAIENAFLSKEQPDPVCTCWD